MIITTVNGFQVNLMAEDVIDVIPNDAAPNRDQPGILFVSVPGNVRVITAAGTERTLVNFSNEFSLLVRKIFASGTTAQGVRLLM
ncbi:MAG: hypothetical protein C0424_10390 [Sphingobacteriaceae bacterium]|nr:hypothetical protein [Sphingobacteriaceae bacterium]